MQTQHQVFITLFLTIFMPLALCAQRAGSVAFRSGYELHANLDKYFYHEPLPDSVFLLMQGRSYKSGCTVPRNQLRYVRVLHHTGKGDVLYGELVIDKRIAPKVVSIMRSLYEHKYPIERMVLVDRYDADDERSMSANNTSAFNYRPVAGSRKLSLHSRGLAIDINPLYNPCVRHTKKGRVVQPKGGYKYVERGDNNPYMLHEGDVCVSLFKSAGFRWGGNYKSLKDYQHFEWVR